jgi:hypothetical protein
MRRDRGVERSSIRCQARRLARGSLGLQLHRAHLDVTAIVIGQLRGGRLRASDRRACVGWLVQFGICEAQLSMRHGKRRIDAQRLLKRSRGVNPHVRMQVGQPLFVIALCLRGLGRDRVVRLTDAGAKCDGTFEQFLRDDRDGVSCVLTRERDKEKERLHVCGLVGPVSRVGRVS